MKKPVREITFPGSGETAWLPNVSLAALASKMKRKYPAPEPPLQGADGIFEKNYTAPEYKLAKEAHTEYISEKAYDVAMRRLYNLHLTDEMEKQVTVWKDANPEEWDEKDTDKHLWLEEIAMETTEDFEALIDFLGAGDSKQETVKAIQDGF